MTVNDQEERDPSWSRDGRSIYYVALVDGRETVRRQPAVGGQSVLVLSSGGREPVESADGRTLRFVREGSLYAFSLSAADDQRLSAGSWGRPARQWAIGRNTQFGPAAVTFLVDNPDSAAALEQLDLSIGKTVRVGQIGGVPAAAIAGFALSPNKRSLSIVVDQGSIGELTTVEGWRVDPFANYLLDLRYFNYLTRWVLKIQDWIES